MKMMTTGLRGSLLAVLLAGSFLLAQEKQSAKVGAPSAKPAGVRLPDNFAKLNLADEQKKKILEYAADVRKFEISLFWQRSLFFWGFIGAAFVAYGVLIKLSDKDNALAVSCRSKIGWL